MSFVSVGVTLLKFLQIRFKLTNLYYLQKETLMPDSTMQLLPPASEGWGRYCFHRCLSVHTRVGGVPQSQVLSQVRSTYYAAGGMLLRSGRRTVLFKSFISQLIEQTKTFVIFFGVTTVIWDFACFIYLRITLAPHVFSRAVQAERLIWSLWCLYVCT